MQPGLTIMDLMEDRIKDNYEDNWANSLAPV